MMTKAFMVADSEAFRPLPFTPSRGPVAASPRLAQRRRVSMGVASAAEVQKSLMVPSAVPNWALYSGSALLVTGGVLGLMQDDKSLFSMALGVTMIGVGGYLFFQTLKG